VGADDEKLGTVAYVVVQPSTLDVTDIIVSTGSVLGRDIVVAKDQVERVQDGTVHLTLDKRALDACKDYVDVDFKAPPADWTPAPELAYPAGGMLWPAAGMYYPQGANVTVNTPTGTVGLHHGMEVLSDDGEKVGSIDALETDPSAGHVTHLIIKEGFILSHDASIPAEWVQSVESDRVRLKVGRAEIERRFQKER
jgi:sporulation protein YlmC with PRC-barrel domain